MARRLFGTDGVRGPAGEVVTAELALGLGRAAAERADGERPHVLVIRDTRESGAMLEAGIAAGVTAAGGDVLLGGVLPTPAAPMLIDRYGLRPRRRAVCLAQPLHRQRDQVLRGRRRQALRRRRGRDRGRARSASRPSPSGSDACGRCTARSTTTCARCTSASRDLDLDGLDVLLDCANGATYRAGPAIFERLGARVTAVAVEPDGRNINAGCGSTHVERLAEAVVAGGHDVGFAFDGDGDRVLAADRTGGVVDGDELMALAAKHLRATGRLAGGGVAVTVMTNYGFHAAMAEAGVEVATTQVGDRYVLEELRARGWALGGEQSGHIIELGFAPTGDGIAGALLALEALDGEDLADRHGMDKLPQRLVNVRVRDRGAMADATAVGDAVERESAALEGRGRVLVRPSGTEPLVRVMVEAPTEAEAGEVCDRLVAVVEAEIG